MSHVLSMISVAAKYDVMNRFPYSSDIDSPFTYYAAGVPPEDVPQNCVLCCYSSLLSSLY